MYVPEKKKHILIHIVLFISKFYFENINFCFKILHIYIVYKYIEIFIKLDKVLEVIKTV